MKTSEQARKLNIATESDQTTTGEMCSPFSACFFGDATSHFLVTDDLVKMVEQKIVKRRVIRQERAN